jgi:hypothetical protein
MHYGIIVVFTGRRVVAYERIYKPKMAHFLRQAEQILKSRNPGSSNSHHLPLSPPDIYSLGFSESFDAAFMKFQ